MASYSIFMYITCLILVSYSYLTGTGANAWMFWIGGRKCGGQMRWSACCFNKVSKRVSRLMGLAWSICIYNVNLRILGENVLKIFRNLWCLHLGQGHRDSNLSETFSRCIYSVTVNISGKIILEFHLERVGRKPVTSSIKFNFICIAPNYRRYLKEWQPSVLTSREGEWREKGQKTLWMKARD